ncbi:MAG TPA: CAP domain-containing protein [Acidimicrobiia bacterium]|nr:CAP domain-containing protein [Acidimicrobiia bacterium]
MIRLPRHDRPVSATRAPIARRRLSVLLTAVLAGVVLNVVGVPGGSAPASASHCPRGRPDPDIARAWPAPFTALSANRCGNGYRLLLADGGVFAFGAATYEGSVPGLRAGGHAVGLSKAIDLAPTPSGEGYWMLDADGGVFAFGDARFRGSLPQLRAAGALRTDTAAARIVATPSGRGYVILDQSGGVFAFGDAPYAGSLPGLRAAGWPIGVAPAVDIAVTRSGRGYWIVDANGGVFAFGDARFHGSVPGLRAAGKISGQADAVAVSASRDGRGYVILDRAGGVFPFGVRFAGSAAGREAGMPAADVALSASGDGYWILFANGAVHAFGDAPRFGSAGGSPTTDLLARANAERAARGIPPLAWSAAAASAAEQWSPHMAATGYRHGGAGLLGNSFAQTGENLFALPAGMATSGHAHRGWMGSDAHRRNILDPGFDAVGIGAYCGPDGTLWLTQIFVKYHGSTRPPLSGAVPAGAPVVRPDPGGAGC